MFRLKHILDPKNVLMSDSIPIPDQQYIKIISTIADPVVAFITCIGEITVQSVKNGVAVTETYSDLSGAQLAIQADVNTEIKIIGDVTVFICGEYQGWGYADTVLAKSLEFNNSVLAQVVVTGKDSYGAISTVESMVFNNTAALTILACDGCAGLTALDLSANTALHQMVCDGCTGLTALDLSANTALTYLSCGGCTGLTEIKYPATNSSVSTSIAGAISNATAADGTVYTDSQGAYYSTIADAATAKGWTVYEL